jgi:1,4-alpha-glucan branching enzyme
VAPASDQFARVPYDHFLVQGAGPCDTMARTPTDMLLTPDALNAALDALAHGTSGDPFAILGPHVVSGGGTSRVVILTVQPSAARVEVVRFGRGDERTIIEMRRLPQGIVFAAQFPGETQIFDYRLRVTTLDGQVSDLDDPYRYGQVMGELDLHLLGEGRHYRAFERLGSHALKIGQATGTYFAVWAPNADRVSLVGDFNQWHGLAHPMRRLVPNGIWELFVPGLGAGERYKYEIRGKLDRTPFLKADPYAREFETPPATAALTSGVPQYRWRDDDWVRAREASNGSLSGPISIYEVHLASWARVADDGNRSLSYRELAERLVPYAKDMGFTHIELMPVLEHPFGGSWGYQVTGFFAPTSRHGSPDDFRWFVDECHRHGLGVLLDWVPGHFPKDAHGLARFDGTALYEHEDPRMGEHQDWGTLIFNYGRHEVSNFLVASALFWIEQFHLDGLRVDAVASMLYLDYSRQEGQWLPNRHGGRENIDAVAFLRHLNEIVHAEHPGVMMIAEESTAWPAVSRPVYGGGLGFTYKWNMGWMHDILAYMQKDPVHRQWEHRHLTFSMLYAYNENFVLPFSHDEVVHGKGSMISKMPGDDWQKAANLRALYAYMFVHPGKKLLFMGNEIAAWREWDDGDGLPWAWADDPPHAGVQQLVRDLNRIYREQPALHQVDYLPTGFGWIDCDDAAHSVLSLIRRDEHGGEVVAVFNFTPVVREGYRMGVPRPGRYRELVNTDAAVYGGGNIGNAGWLDSESIPAQSQGQSLVVTLPPLAGLILKRD